MNIGEKLRKFRKENKLTLVELSEKTGVDAATLSRIERNLMTGTVDSHLKICNALGIAIADLYGQIEPAASRVDIFTKGSKEELFVPTDKHKFNYEMLATNVLKKKMMPVLIKLDAGGITQAEQTPYGTEKFCYCLEGEIELDINSKKYILKNGDALYFDSSLKHTLKNLSKKQSRCICVTSPPFL